MQPTLLQMGLSVLLDQMRRSSATRRAAATPHNHRSPQHTQPVRVSLNLHPHMLRAVLLDRCECHRLTETTADAAACTLTLQELRRHTHTTN